MIAALMNGLLRYTQTRNMLFTITVPLTVYNVSDKEKVNKWTRTRAHCFFGKQKGKLPRRK